MLLEIAQLPRATFYYHAKRMVRQDKYAIIKTKISEIFHENQGRYGYRHIPKDAFMLWVQKRTYIPTSPEKLSRA